MIYLGEERVRVRVVKIITLIQNSDQKLQQSTSNPGILFSS